MMMKRIIAHTEIEMANAKLCACGSRFVSFFTLFFTGNEKKKKFLYVTEKYVLIQYTLTNPVGKIAKNSLKECVFVNSALKIQPDLT